MPKINSRSKGIRGERHIIDFLQPIVTEVYTFHGKQSPLLQRNTLQCDQGGSDISGLPSLALEIKNCAVLSLGQWWGQCTRQAAESITPQTPVLIYKAKKGIWKVRMQGAFAVDGLPVLQSHLLDFTLEEFAGWLRLKLAESLSEGENVKDLSPQIEQGPPGNPEKKPKQTLEGKKGRGRPANVAKSHSTAPAITPHWPFSSEITSPTLAKDLQQANRGGPTPEERLERLGYAAQAELAIAWCKQNGWKVPERLTPEFSEMFNYWYHEALNGKVQFN